MPKIIDHDQRRRDIVAVAKKLIIDGGFEAATMRSIVTAAGFANGALKHYFPSKDSIIEATFESVLAETAERISAVDPDLPPLAALRAAIQAGMPLDAHRIASGRVLLALWEHSVANPELASRYRQLLEQWRAALVVQLAEIRGESRRSAAAGILADEIISVTIGAHVASLMHPPGELVRRYNRYLDGFIARVTA